MKLSYFLTRGFFFAAVVLFTTAAAAADRRVALVIGNAAYQNASSLSNTINDSSAIAALFRSVGFEVVISRTDLGVVDFKRAVREFLNTAENSDIAVVYYAGHGVEIGGTNYLVPVDAKLARDYDVEDEAVALDRIIWALQSVRRLRLILLDACRDNPFPGKLRSAGVRATVKGGLSKIEDVSADTLVAYAAKAGSVSYDGDGANSPYATALIKHVAEPGVDIRIALGRVRDDVLAKTGGRQEPFIYGSLGGATISLVPPLPANNIERAPGSPTEVERIPSIEFRKSAPVAPSSVLNSPVPPAFPAPVKGGLAKTPQSTLATRDPADVASACSRDEQRLARLRTRPSREDIASFLTELTCQRLRPQVERLSESIATDPQPPAVGTAEAARQAQNQPIPVEDACVRDAARLARLRADPTIEGVTKFERELSCDQIRPQLRRLRESLEP